MGNRWILISMCWVTGAGAQALDSAQAILDCAGANAPEESFQQSAEMTVVRNEQVQREILATFAGQRAERGVMLNIGVREPPDLAGTSLLLRQQRAGRDDMKLYLPALRRVRTVTGAMAGQELLGTDFSYLDIKQVYGAFDASGATLLEAGTWKQRPIYRVRLRPVADAAMVYSRLEIGIDQEFCTPLVIEFFGEQDVPVKRLEGDPGSLMPLGTRHLLARYTMKNLVEAGETRLSLGVPEFDEKVARSAFSPSAFYNFHGRAPLPE